MTRFQAVFAVAAISEAFLLPILVAMIKVLPFTMLCFHPPRSTNLFQTLMHFLNPA